MKELTLKQIANKLRCIFSRLTKLEQRTFEQVNADWNATTGPEEILNKPDLSLKADSRPYKVYTALLSQSGSGDFFQQINSGDLDIGVTYLIQSVGGADFSNVGGSNVEGEYFIATGTTPNSWGTGGQLEYTPAAPVVTVLENTIGNIWFTYNGIGIYHINSIELFTQNKTVVFIQNTTEDSNNSSTNLGYAGLLPYNIQIITAVQSGGLWLNDDTVLNNTPIEIRVYN